MLINLLAGPPFGPRLYDGVCQRLEQCGLNSCTIDPFSECDNTDEMIRWMEQRIKPGDALVAHGTAVPLAVAVTQNKQIETLFLSNGPIKKPDPILNLYGKTPVSLRKALLNPFCSIPALKSSAGLRRLVVNPYVMDRDTIVRVCEPLIKSKNHRRRYAEYIGKIDRMTPLAQPGANKICLIWGDSDLLYPTHHASSVLSGWKNTIAVEIEGAKHLHPIESPWAMADIIKSQIVHP